jgi:chromate reductase, NAD(P)H dehydrogenase (quinone)
VDKIEILVGTDRPKSRSLQIAQIIKPFYEENGYHTELMELSQMGLSEHKGIYSGEEKPATLADGVDRIIKTHGLVVVCPEYNGSYPGVLKLFIDHWKYPESFEHRPVCFIGLGGRFGGLRPVEHLQQVFGYRNAFVYPDRVFLQNIWSLMSAEQVLDGTMTDLLRQQAQGFCRFIKALRSEKLHGGDYN